ncbi:hypothetical protein VTJ49DRAFT_6668 [Mycothermus thermophilus]|uniref:CHY-type domain-containing protein n=1 Tax=Humicola insolens TaxID=85995 RepID=A0ABR3V1K1_HUMIN
MIPIRTRGGVSPRSSRQAITEASPSRAVSRPVPEREAKDARGYQLEQLRRRYSPTETELDNGDLSLLFNLKPSDPDFPFDLDHLECDLRVPVGYPKSPPQLQVRNKNIPRGFAINIEKGWDGLVREKRGATLLALTNALDRRLEAFLSEQKAETVKLTIFKDTRHLDAEPSAPVANPPEAKTPVAASPPPATRAYVPEPSFSSEEIAAAKARRAQEVRQLEARMSRLPIYHKSSDGVVYTLSLEPRHRTSLPSGLQQVQSVQLIIPLLYPLQPLRVLLNNVDSEEAEPLEELFAQKAAGQNHMTLTSHLNYLAQNMHSLAKQAQKPAPAPMPAAPDAPARADQEAAVSERSSTLDKGKGHVHLVPRPPEWVLDDANDSYSSDGDSYDDEDGEADGDAAVEQGQQSSTSVPFLPTQTPERGTAMSFPSVELHGIELLQVAVLGLVVKCDRCKTLNDVTGLKDNLEKSGSCTKCATPFAVRFRQELVHQNSFRAGFIDATGCTVADMLPSTFIPTCSRCSTPSSTGFTCVRGDATTNVCRECHARFTFSLPEVKFLAYAPGMHNPRLAPARLRGRQDEKLGLRAGEPLPSRGTCVHYRKSYRWFRFSCCAKCLLREKRYWEARQGVLGRRERDSGPEADEAR